MSVLGLLRAAGIDTRPLATERPFEDLTTTIDVGSLGIVLALAASHLEEHPHLVLPDADAALHAAYGACARACAAAESR